MTFSELSQYFQKLEQTASRNAMTEILADLFRKASAREIGKICYLLQGRVVPLYEAIEFGMADKFVIRAIKLAYGVDEKTVLKEFHKAGDLGSTAQEIHAKRKVDDHLTVSDVFEKLTEIAHTTGTGSQEKKIGLLSDILKAIDASSTRFVVRIVLDKLRLGFSDMTILDGLSWMVAGDKLLRPAIESVYNVRPDIGHLAVVVKEKGVEGLKHVNAKVGAPILASLCQRLPTAVEMIKKMGKVAVEPKYDGVRVQIHYKRLSAVSPSIGLRVNHQLSAFSRNLENITAMFPELEEVGKQLNAKEVILDSEAIGMDPKTGKYINFQETMTRKRKHNITLFSENVPIKFFVFDMLYKDGKDLLSVPLSDRRKSLEETVKNGKILEISPQVVTTDADVIRQYHEDQRHKGLEGVVVKKWESPYEPGRRGYSWVKFKEEEGKTGKLTDTIDAVVMGYYSGEGKRSGFGIGALLVGIKKDDGFVTITKIGTGVSDQLWKSLRARLNQEKVSTQPKEYKEVNKLFIPSVWVAPKLVVEIAGDDLTKSSTHGAGIAVRFPRLVRIRDDKTPHQATSLDEIRQMYENQDSQKRGQGYE